MMSRHIVLIHRYYAPDTPPYAAILARIATEVAGQGHRVTVLTCQPSYRPDVVAAAPRREVVDGVRIVRWQVLADRHSTLLKLINALWFSLRLLAAIPGLGRVDTVMAASTPPVFEGLVGRIVARAKRARFVYHHQDIYPEVSNGLHPGGLLGSKVLRAVDSATDRGSQAVVVLSADMRDLVASRGVAPDRILVLNNFDPWRYAEPAVAAAVPSSRLRVLYAGNLGRFQNLPAVFDALVDLADEPEIEFDFVGDGALAADLQSLIADRGLANVRFHGYQAPEVLSERIRQHADIGLVSLEPGVIRAAYPSKVMSYLRNGLPVLAVVEPDSELAGDLVRRGAGWVVDASRLPCRIRELARHRDAVGAARSAAREMYAAQFTPEVALPRWTAALTGPTDSAVG